MRYLRFTLTAAAVVGFAAMAHAQHANHADGVATLGGSGGGSGGSCCSAIDYSGPEPRPANFSVPGSDSDGSTLRPAHRPVGHVVTQDGFNPELVRRAGTGSFVARVASGSGRFSGEIHAVNGRYTYFSYTGTLRSDLGAIAHTSLRPGQRVGVSGTVVDDGSFVRQRPQPRTRIGDAPRPPRDARPHPNPDRPSLNNKSKKPQGGNGKKAHGSRK